MRNPLNELAPWQTKNPELQRLLTTLFETRSDAPEHELIAAGEKFVAKYRRAVPSADQAKMVEALNAQINQLASLILTPSDRSVCRQLGLTPLEFLQK
jgi:uncharacterized phage infection (PIP) family protein YhgE